MVVFSLLYVLCVISHAHNAKLIDGKDRRMTHDTQQAFGLSFEYFPPQTDTGAARLWNAVSRHAVYNPDFVSITYGAGGTTQEHTLKLLSKLSKKTRLKLAGHLTCVGASKTDVLNIAQQYRELGVNRIVALRGDGQNGDFVPHPDGFETVIDLIKCLSQDGFDVTVGAYPEPHPESYNAQSDMDHFKAKFDAGANRAITQFFFEKDMFLRFRDESVKVGISAQIIPGILPIENFTKAKRFADRCGATIPSWLDAAFHNAQTDAERHILSVSIACDMIENLRSEGVENFHLYTLNNPDICADICKALGRDALEPAALQVA